MRRFLALAVVAFLMVAVASPVNAGYLIIRIILEGGPGEGAPSGGPGGPGGIRPGGSGSGPPGSGMASGTGGPAGPGKPNGLGTIGGPGAPPPPTTAATDPTRCIVVVVPVEEDLSKPTPFYHKRVFNSETNPFWKMKLHLTYRGEPYVTNLFTDGMSIQWYEKILQMPAPKKTRITEVTDLHIKWLKTKTDSQLLLNALNAALAAGMCTEALAYADELLAFTQEKPENLSHETAKFVAAYGKMQKGIKAVATKPNRAEYWQRKFNAPYVRTQNHYTLIYWDASDFDVKRRLDLLEDNFKAFFIWHATRGIEFPVPETPMIAVLPRQANDVFNYAKALDAPARLTADGFYSPEHEVLILSPDRLDEVGATFQRQNQQMYQQGVSRESLLRGDGPKIFLPRENQGGGGVPGPGGFGQPPGGSGAGPGPGGFGQPPGGGNPPPKADTMKPEEVARMQTIALVDRLAEDVAVISAISREGSRQLLYATQQLPKYVGIPEWLSNGAGNFYTRPKEPAFITNSEGGQVMHVANATGYGIPNYALQRYFKDLLDKNELNPDRAAVLKNVLTDAYFHGLRDQKEIHDPDPAKVDNSGIALNSGPQAGPLPGGNAGQPGKPPGGPGPGLPPPGKKGGSGSGPPGSGPPGVGPGPGPGGSGMQVPGKHDEDHNFVVRKMRERLSIKAQATSWALYYYLSKAKPAELQIYLNELAAMPRDIPLQGEAVQAFYRAFNLDGSKESLDSFAQAWIKYVHDTAPAGIDVTLVQPKAAPAPSSVPTGPGIPGFGK
ncbi:MAG TPA: hypothetical protein VG097_10970 [Gemmata sp.]|jgi:hypothetical protein|nr:hypothetical protein [Gemmata sp.]